MKKMKVNKKEIESRGNKSKKKKSVNKVKKQ